MMIRVATNVHRPRPRHPPQSASTQNDYEQKDHIRGHATVRDSETGGMDHDRYPIHTVRDRSAVIDPIRDLPPRLSIFQTFSIQDRAGGVVSIFIDSATRIPNVPSFVSPKWTSLSRRSGRNRSRASAAFQYHEMSFSVLKTIFAVHLVPAND